MPIMLTAKTDPIFEKSRYADNTTSKTRHVSYWDQMNRRRVGAMGSSDIVCIFFYNKKKILMYV